MKKLILLVAIVFSGMLVLSQGIIITKAGDTIVFLKYEYKKSYDKYWVEGQENPIKIKSSVISNRISFNDYKLIRNEVDEFTGDLKRTTEMIRVGGTKPKANGYSSNLVIRFKKIVSSSNTTYAILLRTPVEIGCCGAEGNYVMIKFINNEVIKLKKDIAKIDCDQNAVSVYVLEGEILEQLKTTELKSIRFRQSEGYLDFYAIFPDCIVKGLKTLE